MGTHDYLFVIAIILLATKLFGLITEGVHVPQVVGALLAGIILGPSIFNVLSESEFISQSASIGVIMLMFIAGLDTEIDELKKTGLASVIIALAGVIVPLVGCGLVYYFFFEDSFNTETILRSTFIGIIFAATSVSITIETLKEMGKLKSTAGTAIIGAAIIDDIIGIILLSVVSGFGKGSGGISAVLLKILGFFIFAAIIGYIAHVIFQKLDVNHSNHRRIAIWALAFCFLMSYIAEKFFGIADITGAYVSGLMLCNIYKTKEYVARKISISSYMFFAPIFFASIGLQADFKTLNGEYLIFAGVLLIVAILTKVVGCGGAAKLSKLSSKDSLCVGVGMVSRGEVALIIAQKGLALGLISQSVFPPVVLVAITTSLITPILLQMALNIKDAGTIGAHSKA